MRIIADTHTHTLMSGHAYSTIKEMAEMAKERGMELIAFTEHAPTMPSTCGLYYFQNLKILPRERWGITTLYGAELNILDKDGTVDLPEATMKRMDLCIASIHTPCYGSEKTVENVTSAMINAMQNPYVNIIGHPDDDRFPVDYERLVRAAKETGTLLEINNSSVAPESFRMNCEENMKKMLRLCKKYEVMITTGSDAHVDLRAGEFTETLRILKDCDFPKELVATTSLETLKPFLNRYKK